MTFYKMGKMCVEYQFHAAAIIAAIALWLAILPGAFGSDYSFRILCKNDTCVEGEMADWVITLSNEGQYHSKFSHIELVTTPGGATFLEEVRSYYVNSSEKSNPVIVPPSGTEELTLKRRIPKPNYGDYLRFNICLTSVLDSKDAYYNEDGPFRRYCSNLFEQVRVFECIQDIHCSPGSLCVLNRCEPIECGPCQYPLSRKCTPYECCYDSNCSYDERCENHECIPLGCRDDEAYLNHACIPLACGAVEIAANHTCISLNCSEDQYLFNQTCVPLLCGYDEYPNDHDCHPLNCSDTEGYGNNSCVPLGCKTDESYLNHSCIPLSCGMFGKAIDHECVMDGERITRLSVEILFILGIGLFVYLDIRKYQFALLEKRRLKFERSQKEKQPANDPAKGIDGGKAADGKTAPNDTVKNAGSGKKPASDNSGAAKPVSVVEKKTAEGKTAADNSGTGIPASVVAKKKADKSKKGIESPGKSADGSGKDADKGSSKGASKAIEVSGKPKENKEIKIGDEKGNEKEAGLPQAKKAEDAAETVGSGSGVKKA